MDQLILLPEEDAERSHFDAANCQTLFRLLAVCTVAAIVIALVMGFFESYPALVIPGLNLVLIRALYSLREHPVLTRHFRPLLLSFLLVQSLLWKAVYFDPGDTVHVADFLGPLMLAFFRLPGPWIAVPLGLLWTLSVGRNLVSAALGAAELAYPLVIFQSALTLVVFALVTHLTTRQRREFLATWRREAHRQRERRRMQEELDDARKLQLSMLPHSEPKLPWLDVAGISIPASEVGGDYYDYFPISDSRLAIAVGDVAGHGVASGLVLSGVRSCLHLLQETPLEPAEILAKIDRMVRNTAIGHRSFMTLLYAVFDQVERTVIFAAAGHPPLLHRHARTGEVEELVSYALPVGTRLGTEPRQRLETFAPGDVFLFTTDGLAETVNRRGDLFGDQRLQDRLRGLSADRSAREIRDTLLGDVWSFKADEEQLDDVTVVVAKLL